MRGPIDYIVVSFEGNNFRGEILNELSVAVNNGTIAVLDMALIAKDAEGTITSIEINTIDNDVARAISSSHSAGQALINDEDIDEIGEILDENCSAGLLIVEQLWAKGLKQAILNANGELIAEGRIHPDAAKELNDKEGV